ncbi:hypothetical protein [Sphingomonas sp. 28-63-12]|uniref:hypothetical protein n=1 Tax=Sphingomonas sp. 28-63-12 TaxID=1970434 RepID=UPI0035A83FEA
MRSMITMALFATAAIGLSACSPKAQNETAEAADAITADANATMMEAKNDTEAASDQAFGAAENAMDRGSEKLDNIGDAVGNEIED